MKNVIQVLVAAFIIVNLTGCTSTKGYFADRGRDAADIFTASVGVGAGAKTRIGPLQVGALAETDITGLRGGTAFFLPLSGRRSFWSFCDVVSPVPFPGLCAEVPCLTSYDEFDGDWSALDAYPSIHNRGKSYTAGFPYVPFVTMSTRGGNAYCTQIEIVAGLGPCVRLGFNPGELLDFALGWFKIDIYNDDLEARKQREKSNQMQEDTTRKLADPQH